MFGCPDLNMSLCEDVGMYLMSKAPNVQMSKVGLLTSIFRERSSETDVYKPTLKFGHSDIWTFGLRCPKTDSERPIFTFDGSDAAGCLIRPKE